MGAAAERGLWVLQEQLQRARAALGAWLALSARLRRGLERLRGRRRRLRGLLRHRARELEETQREIEAVREQEEAARGSRVLARARREQQRAQAAAAAAAAEAEARERGRLRAQRRRLRLFLATKERPRPPPARTRPDAGVPQKSPVTPPRGRRGGRSPPRRRRRRRPGWRHRELQRLRQRLEQLRAAVAAAEEPGGTPGDPDLEALEGAQAAAARETRELQDRAQRGRTLLRLLGDGVAALLAQLAQGQDDPDLDPDPDLDLDPDPDPLGAQLRRLEEGVTRLLLRSGDPPTQPPPRDEAAAAAPQQGGRAPAPPSPRDPNPSRSDPNPEGPKLRRDPNPLEGIRTPPGKTRIRSAPDAPRAAPSPLRWAQALSCCLAFSTAAAAGPWLPGEGDGCVAAWAISFSLTLLLLAAEAAGRLPARRDLPLIHALAAAMACLAAAVIWSMGHLRDGGRDSGRPRALRATATVGSCLATLAYAAEVIRDRAKPGQTAPYLATPSGLLKVAETFLALLLLGLAAERGAGSGPEAWRWCLGIYCVSFAVGILVIGGCLGGWGWCGWGQDPVGTRRALGAYAAAGVVAYGAAVVLWPLYAFREEMGGTARRPAGCNSTCPWDRHVLVALLTAVNLVAYGVDLVQTGRLVLLRA
ncbi:uncharacterized protein [Ciconia boyciana]|uniref:uncharacterized protein n=1 Tax=Ciconia boyciana TaxID=52775 RepID=UPI003B9DD4CA